MRFLVLNSVNSLFSEFSKSLNSLIVNSEKIEISLIRLIRGLDYIIFL